jgi:3-deoxy-D-manno-octulosonic acid kinase
MVAFDASESLTPFRRADGSGAGGAILFDASQLRQAGMKSAVPGWFDPDWWGPRATRVGSGGRGGAWFVDGGPEAGGFGPAVLRLYLRGGLVAKLTRARYLWRGANRTRSFAEFRLLRELQRRHLPVPRPIAAIYWRDGPWYYAGILLERLEGVTALADLAAARGADAPWAQAGQLIARLHRGGLDHADLNAHNLLFDDAGTGWAIDLDRGALRIPATGWREKNLARLHRSLLKLRGARSEAEVDRDYAVLRAAYDAQWQRGT